jgi:hypothetical protein
VIPAGFTGYFAAAATAAAGALIGRPGSTEIMLGGATPGSVDR